MPMSKDFMDEYMKFMKLSIFTVAVLLTIATQAVGAGAWSSSGGDVFSDGENPWFIQQTTETIRYCTVFGASFDKVKEHASAAIIEAVQYWQREFAVHQPFEGGQTYIKTGTQAWEALPDCDGSEDVTFQFGFLTAEQRSHLNDLKDTIAIAIRTDYDRINLRAKGFIYIAPLSGPNRPQKSDLDPDAYTPAYPKNLSKVLAHELGHVFGLQHDGMAPQWLQTPAGNLMAADFPDYVVGSAALSEAVSAIPPYFSFTSWQEIRLGSGGDFFGLPKAPDPGNLLVKIDATGLTASTSGPGGSTLILGSVPQWTSKEIVDWTPAVRLWLPPEQRVFRPQLGQYVRNLQGAGRYRIRYVGTYLSAKDPAHACKSITATVGPGKYDAIDIAGGFGDFFSIHQ